jgi:hypothetical protein
VDAIGFSPLPLMILVTSLAAIIVGLVFIVRGICRHRRSH